MGRDERAMSKRGPGGRGEQGSQADSNCSRAGAKWSERSQTSVASKTHGEGTRWARRIGNK